ncbi:MAG: Lrp/AsnC family transcriptional regulator [Pseudoruegeria sp.]
MNMDSTDKKILALLAQDARKTHARIAQDVGLATSSVTERIKKLTQSGVIKRWTVEIDYSAVGLPILAVVYVFASREGRQGAFEAEISELPNVLECHHVTGAWSYLLKVRAASIADFERFILEDLQAMPCVEKTHTEIVLSSQKATANAAAIIEQQS